MYNLSTVFGGGAILITSLFFLFRGNGLKNIKKIFSKNQEEIETKIKKLQVEELEQSIEIKKAEKVLEEKKQKATELITTAKKEIEEIGKIKDPKKLLEEFNKW